MASPRYWPLWQLTLSRLRTFYREPVAIFWVYGFPLLMALALGIAFRETPQERIAVDLIGAGDVAAVKQKLERDPKFSITLRPVEDWKKRLQSGKTDLVIEADGDASLSSLKLWDQPYRTESRLARYAVESQLLHGASDPPDSVQHLDQTGTRYIDFLLPGLMGLNLMGGGLWGVGFVLVDMRVRKLLKRFLATPMRRSDFLIAVMISRLFFTLTDIIILMIFGYFVFGVRCQGNYLELTTAVLVGGVAFAGIGLLVACRAQTIETISGLMNLVMLPMWVFSGVFFSSERFPAAAQPIINVLPLTALNHLLRGIILDGKSLTGLLPPLAILAVWGIVSFAVALRLFRWR